MPTQLKGREPGGQADTISDDGGSEYGYLLNQSLMSDKDQPLRQKDVDENEYDSEDDSINDGHDDSDALSVSSEGSAEADPQLLHPSDTRVVAEEANLFKKPHLKLPSVSSRHKDRVKV